MFSLNYAYTVFGLWYSTTLFKKNGWQVPKTWDDFMTLCAHIKAAGMAPFAHQGKYPYYMMVPLMDMVAKNGGPEVADRHRQPGAERLEGPTRSRTASRPSTCWWTRATCSRAPRA